MRYTVGKQYPFIIVQFERTFIRENAVLSTRRMTQDVITYYPFPSQHSSDKLINIVVKMLTCKEHHKVPSEWEPNGEKKYDGFIFEDTEGNTWRNQYPHASYGQVSDAADRRVWLHHADEAKMKEAYASDFVIVEMQLATSMIESIQEAIWRFEGNVPKHYKHPGKRCEVELKAMQEFMQQVTSAVEAVAGRKIVLDKLMVQDGTYEDQKDTSHWLEGHWKARFEDEPTHPVWGFKKVA